MLPLLFAAALLGPGAPKGGGKADAIAKMQKLYREGHYEQALGAIDALRRRTDLSTEEQVLVLKHKAFVLFVLALRDEAEHVWEELLAINPDFKLNPDEVSPEFVQFFGAISPPGAAPKSAPPSTVINAAPASTPASAPISAPPSPPAATEPAPTPPAASTTSPGVRGCGTILCALPFGPGQFLNGKPVRGALYAVLGAATLGVNLGMYWSRAADVNDNGHYDNPDSAATRLTVQRTTFILFFVVGVVSVVDAFLLYD